MPSQTQAQSLMEIDNPFTPGQPIDKPELFFGRRDVLVSIREYLHRGRSVFLVAGSRRMGKTSLLRRLAASLPDNTISVCIELAEENPKRHDWLLWRIAVAVASEVGEQAGVEIAEPAWSDYEGRPGRLLDALWPEVRAALGDSRLVLMLDDVDSLERSGNGLLDGLVDVLTTWRSLDKELALVLTTSEGRQEELVREHASLLGGVLTHVLGPLTSEEAIRMVSWSVEGVLTYDYGVARRLVEIASGHPYFLQLLCHAIFERCAAAGWVNQRDLDVIVDDLVSREISEFRRIWEESPPHGQAVLAALVSLRGARGMATALETHTALSKAGARVRRPQVEEALEQLASRGVLERLGALSYRFRIGLLREWLAERLDLAEVVRETRWVSTGRRRRQEDRHVTRLRVRERRGGQRIKADLERPGGDEPGVEAKSRLRVSWAWAAPAAIVTVAAVLAALLWPRTMPPEPPPTELPPAAPTEAVAVWTDTPAPTTTSAPTSTARPRDTDVPTMTPRPTDTPPVIVSRPVPAIAFFANRSEAEGWTLFVMNSDGGNRTQVAEARAAFLSAPTWSPDGTKVAFVSDGEQSADVWVVDIGGTGAVNLIRDEAADGSPAWSPDGEWLAFASVRDSVYWELYMVRPDGSDLTRLTWWEDASDLWPTWSPDGKRLAFSSRRDGNFEIYAMDPDGGNLLRLTEHPAEDTNPAWSPDGSRIAFESIRDGDEYTDIYVMPVIGGAATNLTDLGWATDRGPTWSPDGSRIAFYSDRDGGWDIYVMGSDGSNVTRITSGSSNDQLPSWRP